MLSCVMLGTLTLFLITSCDSEKHYGPCVGDLHLRKVSDLR